MAPDLLALLTCARLFAGADSVARLVAPASVTLLRCDPGLHVAVASMLQRHVLPMALARIGMTLGGDRRKGTPEDPLDDLLDLARLENPDDTPVETQVAILIAPSRAKARPALSDRDLFQAEIAHKLGTGIPVIVICASRADLPPDCLGLVDLDLALPRCDADMVLDMLRLTHSRSGAVAEAALRGMLPPDEDLARLIGVVPVRLDRALRACRV